MKLETYELEELDDKRLVFTEEGIAFTQTLKRTAAEMGAIKSLGRDLVALEKSLATVAQLTENLVNRMREHNSRIVEKGDDD